MRFVLEKKKILASQVVKNIHTFGYSMEEDSGLFMQWAMTTLQHDEDLEVVEVAPYRRRLRRHYLSLAPSTPRGLTNCINDPGADRRTRTSCGKRLLLW